MDGEKGKEGEKYYPIMALLFLCILLCLFEQEESSSILLQNAHITLDERSHGDMSVCQEQTLPSCCWTEEQQSRS